MIWSVENPVCFIFNCNAVVTLILSYPIGCIAEFAQYCSVFFFFNCNAVVTFNLYMKPRSPFHRLFNYVFAIFFSYVHADSRARVNF